MDNPLVSRREIFVNTLLGFLLVSVFCLPFFLGLVVIRFVFKTAASLITNLWPQLAHPSDEVFLGFLALVMLTSAIGHLRKQRWQNAFLSFAVIATSLSIWLSSARLLPGHQELALLPWTVLLIVGLMPGEARLTRFEFILGCVIVAAVLAVNDGLLGSDGLRRTVATFAGLGMLLVVGLQIRERWNGHRNTGPQAPLSPVP